MVTFSLCMIVRDEEETLGRCLDSVAGFIDEIVVVDTGSTDRTKEVALAYTDKIFDFPWVDDFSAARNAAFERATMDYILWLDADDVILPEDAARFRALKETLSPEIDAVMMRYNTGFDENGRATFSYFRERLVKRSRGFRWREPVHEYLETGGHIAYSDVCVTHAKQKPREGGRNVRIYERQLAQGKSLSSRGMYYYARELKDNGRFSDAAGMFQKFLDSGKGWVEDNITACGELAKCFVSLGDDKNALLSMLRSFSYDTPRAELCCQIGYYFKDRKNPRQAVFWFELAQSLKKPEKALGFFQEDCWGFVPCIECAVCYDRLGDYETAERWNERAAQFKPESPSIAFNRSYFKNRRSEAANLTAGGQEDVAADVSGKA